MFLINVMPALITGFITLAIICVVTAAYVANEKAKALANYTPSIAINDPHVPMSDDEIDNRPFITEPILHPCIVYEQHNDLIVIIAGDTYPIEDIQVDEDIAVGDVVSVSLEEDYAVVYIKHKSIYEVDFYNLNANRDKGYKTMRRSVKKERFVDRLYRIDGAETEYSAGIGRNRISVYGRGLVSGKIYDMWLVEKGGKTVGLVTSTEKRG